MNANVPEFVIGTFIEYLNGNGRTEEAETGINSCYGRVMKVSSGGIIHVQKFV
jgi:hypothetical protein